MRSTLILALWALLGVGGLAAFALLRQLAMEHQQDQAATAIVTTPTLPSPLPPPTVLAADISPVTEPAAPAIAIIIDDLGNQWRHSKRTLDLPGEITLAILPFSPFGTRLAALAEHQGREVILHAPMEPLAHPAWRDGLRRDMSEAELRHALLQMLEALPTVRGVNNHMGSALTQERVAMGWVMEELAPRDLYFIDSRTSPSSQALASARDRTIPSARRDVFLDNVRSPAAIRRQFDLLIRLAHQRGRAIAIGHPYPETLAFLEDMLPQLEQFGVRLVPASHLLSVPIPSELANDKDHQSPTSVSPSGRGADTTARPIKSI